MAATATPMEIDEFINGALVTWLESCLPRAEILSGYASLLDGTIIHSVWLQIDPEPQNNPTEINDQNGITLCIARAKNFESIVRNLKSLFEEELGQTILVLPDAYTLGYHPESRNGLEHMKTLLTLLLGAAVQCPNKELFIARIKELDVETQHAIVELIKQVTDSHSLVLTEESLERLSPANMYSHIIRLSKERDHIHMKWIQAICIETDLNASDCAESGGANNMPRSPSSGMTTSTPSSASNSESGHLAVELADLKSKLRKIRQELEEKSEAQLEAREELEYKQTQYEKLRQESQEWYAEAKRASAYRDEVDILRERAERADRLEIEVQKFREKLTDSEFYKTRVEELREDNRMLLETKEMLEDQLQRSRKRSEHVMTLESEIIKYKQKINDMALERDVDRSKLEELLEENTQLQLVAKNLNTTQEIDKSFSDNDDDCNSGDNSLSEQLTNSAQTRALKLELENRRLVAALDQLKESSFHESKNKILELEKDKKKFSLKIEQMQENLQRMTQQNVELENVFKNALEENKKLQDALDNRQKSYDRQSQERDAERTKLIDLEQHVETLNKEKQRIQTLNESIQRRAEDLERLADTKTKEVEQFAEKTKQYEQTQQKLYDAEAKITACERENASLTKEVTKLKETSEEKSVQLDDSTIKLDTQRKELLRLSETLQRVEQAQAKIIELEKQNQDLKSQRKIDQETIQTLRNDLVSGTLATNKVKNNLEKLGLSLDQSNDQMELNVETVVEKLVRNPETFKTVREIMLNVSREQQDSVAGNENAKSDMCVLCHRKEIFTVEKNIELSSSNEPQELSFEHKVRVSPARDTAEIARLSETNTQLNALNAALQSSNEQLQAESARLSVDVATLGSQITSLNTQHVALQLANSQLAAEKDVLLKENDGLKQAHKNSLQDQITLQCLHDQLSSEYESLNKDKEQLKSAVRDLRNDSRELREHIIALEKRIEELSTQNDNMKTCGEDLSILRNEHSKLTDDFRNLFATSDRFKNEYRNIQEQYKMMRMENSNMKLQNTELSGELSTKSDQFRLMQVEYTKVAQRCEMLVANNADLDAERKALMDNVSQLLSQYHELLAISLEDKQHFHEEEKSYTERVHNLIRQKEKLEEKIMEHYKKSETIVQKKKPFASSLVRRVKKASSDLMNKVPSRNRRSWIDESRTSQFMIGSESGGNDSDNSTEEPISIASDTHLLQRNIPLRQSLQRDLLLDSTLSRGGTVRSSLQAQKRTDLNNSRRNSVHGFNEITDDDNEDGHMMSRSLEPPDVTGSSLTLGTAGSRRTVYLIDENQKLPDSSGNANSGGNTSNNINTSSSSSGTNAATNTTNTHDASSHANVNVESQQHQQMPSTNNQQQQQLDNNSPSTFLMYNRINTTIGGAAANTSNNNITGIESLDSSGGSGGVTTTAAEAAGTPDEKALRKRTEDKSNSIWYEYGCV